MNRRLGVVLLAAIAAAAVFTLPAQASGKSSHRLAASSAHALRAPAGAGVASPSVPNVAWAAAAPMPVGLGEQGGGAGIGNFFWSIGGYDSTFTAQNNVQRYNKGSNTWAAGTPIPGVGGGWVDAAICFDSVNKKIHVVNGSEGVSIYAAHQVYDVIANTWSNSAVPNTIADGNYYSQDSGCGFIGGKMYLWGGYGLTDTNPVADLQELTWVYTPGTDTWADTGKLMTGSGYLWSGYTNSGTTAYSAGGYDLGFVPHNNTQSFTPAGGWVVGPALPVALAGVGEGIVSNHLLVWGGINSAGVMSNKTYGCNLPACPSIGALPFNIPVAKGFFAWSSGATAYSAGGFNDAFVTLTAAEHLP